MSLRTAALAACASVVACTAPDASDPDCYDGLECRVVEVPQVHDAPGGATIGLRLLIGHPKTAMRPGSAPVVFLEGGPGGSIAEVGTGGFARAIAASLGRDVVFLEQRGNALSRPALDCAITSRADPDVGVVQECTNKYARQGYRIEAFHTVENAHDIEAVRAALGVPKVILWGGSYGGELAQTAARLHPGSIAGLLLESSAMTGRPYRLFDQLHARPAKLDGFLSWLTRSCAGHPPCVFTMPGLDAAKELAAFETTVAGAPFQLTPELVIGSPESARSLLLASMYYIPNAVLVLRMMYAVNHGSVRAFDQIRVGSSSAREHIARIIAFAGLNRTVNFVYDCYDAVLNWTDDGLAQAMVGAVSSDDEKRALEAEIAERRGACGALPAPSVPQSELAVPTTTDLPTLFLHGGLDWPTPIEHVESGLGRFTRSQLVTVPCAGHGIQRVFPSCFASIASTFFAEVDGNSFGGAVDASCATTYCRAVHDEDFFVER